MQNGRLRVRIAPTDATHACATIASRDGTARARQKVHREQNSAKYDGKSAITRG